MANTSMPAKEWPINTYWRESSERVSQHWYVSFCLLMFAVQDYLTGVFLKQSGNINWAVTCHYYSMVHTGRLLSFITVGDFPTRHGALRSLFPFPRNRHCSGESNPISFDWLKGLTKDTCPRTYVYVDVTDFREELQTIFQSEQSEVIDGNIKTFGAAFCALGKLRNESNYESLLIAHEKHHDRVTKIFEDMEQASETHADNTIDLAVAAYRAYLRRHLLFADERDAHIAASNLHVCCRLAPGIAEKITDCRQAKNELDRLAERLKVRIEERNSNQLLVQEIMERIDMRIFSGKSSLFNKVAEKVRVLEGIRW